MRVHLSMPESLFSSLYPFLRSPHSTFLQQSTAGIEWTWHPVIDGSSFLKLKGSLFIRFSRRLLRECLVIVLTWMESSSGLGWSMKVSGGRKKVCTGKSAAERFYLVMLLLMLNYPKPAASLGSMSSIAVIRDGTGSSTAICVVIPGTSKIACWSSTTNTTTSVAAGEATFVGIGGGIGFFCGIREWQMQPFCWSISPSNASVSTIHRLSSSSFSTIAVGDAHLCGIPSGNGSIGAAECWRSNAAGQAAPPSNVSVVNVSAGSNFTCGVSVNGSAVCWGTGIANLQPGEPAGRSDFSAIAAGGSHVCGIYSTYGDTYCWGDNTYGQTNFPSNRLSSLALGDRHSCGIIGLTRRIICWGDNTTNQLVAPDVRMDVIAAGGDTTCGVRQGDGVVLCWGGAVRAPPPSLRAIPGLCSTTSCGGDSYPAVNDTGGGTICGGSAANHVCIACTQCSDEEVETTPCGNTDRQCVALNRTPAPAPAPGITPASRFATRRRGLTRVEIVSLVLGTTGFVAGIGSLAACIWIKVRNGAAGDRVHHSDTANNGALTVSQQQQLRRQRSTASSRLHRSQSRASLGRADSFSLEELAAATDDFSEDNKIGHGSFGNVYRGVLHDGREVAIKRGGSGIINTPAELRKMYQDKESAFQSELEFLTRLHHRHLVTLVGYCAEGDERLLVYDFMPNGTVHDHVHGDQALTSPLNSWQMRLSIALQAARGIEYLHTYAVPPIIHRDIKSSNILLDSDWSARVSDFGLSLMGPDDGESHLSMAAAGTVGYMDPEYYRLQHLTTKSDVYSFGVVLLELLTGKRAITIDRKNKAIVPEEPPNQDSEEEQPQEPITVKYRSQQRPAPVNVVDFAVPFILSGDTVAVLDARLETPLGPGEMEAVSMVAVLAEQCVRLEGRERPNMNEIVTRLEMAVAYLKRVGQEEQELGSSKDKAQYSSDEIFMAER